MCVRIPTREEQSWKTFSAKYLTLTLLSWIFTRTYMNYFVLSNISPEPCAVTAFYGCYLLEKIICIFLSWLYDMKNHIAAKSIQIYICHITVTRIKPWMMSAFSLKLWNAVRNQIKQYTDGKLLWTFIPGLKIITTFDWLKPRVLKTNIPEFC